MAMEYVDVDEGSRLRSFFAALLRVAGCTMKRWFKPSWQWQCWRVSLNAVAQDVAKFGGAYRVTSVPDGLQIIQRGKNTNHYEIVPKKAMSMTDYQKLLSQVKLERVQ
jgi:hypothetical protein